ncbi:uncharacterized protein PF3D7_1120000-like [Linepithema humile]|uniref:uncharacterized protein PF3D7_1120000-like n=1 Tax=Linepithema humile TaxID=83485 RepID=UPI00351EA662
MGIPEIQNVEKKMKVNLEVIRRASTILSIKASSNEDPDYWKAKFYEMEKIAMEEKCKSNAYETELKEVKRTSTIKASYDIETSDALDDDLLRSASSHQETKSVSLRNREVVMDTNKRPEEEWNNSSRNKMDRLDMDLAMIRTLDKLGEGMSHLIRETRLLREDLGTPREVVGPVTSGTPVMAASGKKKRNINKLSDIEWEDNKSLKSGALRKANNNNNKKGNKTKNDNITRTEQGEDSATSTDLLQPKLRKEVVFVEDTRGRHLNKVNPSYLMTSVSEDEIINHNSRYEQGRLSVNNSVTKRSYKEVVESSPRRDPKRSVPRISEDESELTYSSLLSRAREKMSLSDLNISDTRLKRAANGGIILEIPGDDAGAKVDRLCDKLRALFVDDKGVFIRRPTKLTQLRVSGMDDSITVSEIKDHLSRIDSEQEKEDESDQEEESETTTATVATTAATVATVATTAVEGMAASQTEKKRGRGRPPTTYEYVGLAKAKKRVAELEQEELERRAELELLDSMALKRKEEEEMRSKLHRGMVQDILTQPSKSSEKLQDTCDRRILLTSVGNAVGTIKEVAVKSGNLKGTYVKALRIATQQISTAMETLANLTASDEITRLEKENNQLKKEMESLREEMRELREQVKAQKTSSFAIKGRSPSPYAMEEDVCMEERERKRESRPRRLSLPPPPTPLQGDSSQPLAKMTGDIIRQVGEMINARFEAIQSRLLPEEKLRPPLGVKGVSKGPQPPKETIQKKKENPKKTSKKKAADKNSGGPPTPVTMSQEAPASKNTSKKVTPAVTFVEVLKRGKHLKVKPALTAEKGQASKPATNKGPGGVKPKDRDGDASAKKKKTRAPRQTAAVVLTIPPETEEKHSWEKILSEARKRVPLKEIEVDYLRSRPTRSGGYLMEVPGERSNAKADKLADRLRETIGVQMRIQISRPVARSELRIQGVDISVTEEELKLAVAEAGGCPEHEVQVPCESRSQTGGTREVKSGMDDGKDRATESPPTTMFPLPGGRTHEAAVHSGGGPKR